MEDRLFGSVVRTDTLVTIGRLSRTYISEIARILGRRPIEIQRAVASLERAGAVVSKRIGNTPAGKGATNGPGARTSAPCHRRYIVGVR